MSDLLDARLDKIDASHAQLHNLIFEIEQILETLVTNDTQLLEALAQIAPVTAIRGNVDTEPWARTLPATEVVNAGGVSIFMLHNLAQLDLKPEAAGFDVVIYGHTHHPKMEERNGVLYFNPGSAGPRRFNLPVSLGKLMIEEGKVRAKLVSLEV